MGLLIRQCNINPGSVRVLQLKMLSACLLGGFRAWRTCGPASEKVKQMKKIEVNSKLREKQILNGIADHL